MTDPPGNSDDTARIARGYRSFADVEAAAASPLYAELARAVAGDPEILRFLAGLPVGKRQPNLLFAAVQYLHGTAAGVAQFRGWVLGDLDRVWTTMLRRATQTNEPARCAALLPILDRMRGPLALIEVGASAGLCLYPDRYAYDYDGAVVGAGPVRLACVTTGDGPVPRALPQVAARIGVDLNPLDPGNPDDLAWLRALIWPGPAAAARLARLEAAAAIAAREPARLLAGDLVDRLPEALALAPEGSTPVIFHTAVLPYLPHQRRTAFVERVRAAGVRWIAQEGPGALLEVDARLPDPGGARGWFVLSVDGRPVAWTAPHGGRIEWLPGASGTIGA